MSEQAIIATLRASPTVDVETGGAALGVKRTVAFRLARETGALCEGVRVIRVGRKLRVPTRPILELLGYAGDAAEDAQ